MPNAILDPTSKQASSTEAAFELSPRRAELRGATVGLLETPKQNADVFMEEVGRLLIEREGAADVVIRRKASVASPAPAEQVDELASTCDVVVTGVGDCGSCSVSAVADGVIFEKRGTPAAVICSDAFIANSDAMARLKGAPGYRYITTSHPVAILSPEEVRDRAAQALPAVASTLVAGGSQGGV